MKSRKGWLGSLCVVLVALGTMFAASATAKGHCFVNTKARYPTLTSPCQGARIAVGRTVTFTVRDLNGSAYKYHPFLDLTKRGPKHGRLRNDTSGKGLFVSLKPVRGHHGRFSIKPTNANFPGYWQVTPGKYYIQIQQIESGCPERGCTVYSPISTIFIK